MLGNLAYGILGHVIKHFHVIGNMNTKCKNKILVQIRTINGNEATFTKIESSLPVPTDNTALK